MTTRFFLMESFLPIEAVYDEQSPSPRYQTSVEKSLAARFGEVPEMAIRDLLSCYSTL